MKKTLIHVNQGLLAKNRKQIREAKALGLGVDNSQLSPVITVKEMKEGTQTVCENNNYGKEALIKDALGNVVARVVYSPNKKLSCGASLWIEAIHPVEVLA